MDSPFVIGNQLTQYATLTAMITPAIFMTACGSLIISTSNRVSRVVDRIRGLNEKMDSFRRDSSGVDFVVDRTKHFSEQLVHLEERSDRLRVALTQLYAAMAAFVGTSLAVAFDVWTKGALREVPTLLAGMGVVLLLGSSFQLFRECRTALMQNREEIEFFRTLRSKSPQKS